MIEFKIDFKQMKAYEKDLKRFAKDAYPFAVRNYLNDAAFDARKKSLKTIKKKFILKNKFTEKSIRVNRATGRQVAAMQSEMGSTLEYMADQEIGGTKISRGKQGVPLTTSYAAGQGRSKDRRKLATSRNRLRNIQLNKASQYRGRNRKQTMLVRAIISNEEKNPFFMDSKGGKKAGIYKIVGARKRGKWKGRGWPKGGRIEMLHSLDDRSVPIRKRPWMKPSVEMTKLAMPRMYRDRLIEQLKRRRLFVKR